MAYSEPTPRRRRWPLFLPFAVVIALAAIWSGLWYYGASMAEAAIARRLEREAKAGRIYSCENQTISGYPFRIEVRCDSVGAELRSMQPPVTLKGGSALFVWQIYQPTLVIGEFSGPWTIGAPGAPARYVANWTLARMSLRGTPSAPERMSIVADNPTVAEAGASADASLLKAARIELHGRMAEGSIASSPVLDLVLRLNAASAPDLHKLTAEPFDAEIAATVRGLRDLAPKPWRARLREFQAHDGSVEITSARVQQGDVIAVGAGTLALSARGALDGQMQVTVVGLEQVLKALDLERIMSEGTMAARINRLDRIMPGLADIARRNAGPGIVAGLGALGQRTVLEGKPAVTVPLRFTDGAVSLGPIPVGRIPPLL